MSRVIGRFPIMLKRLSYEIVILWGRKSYILHVASARKGVKYPILGKEYSVAYYMLFQKLNHDF
jgi:hypothetical protein